MQYNVGDIVLINNFTYPNGNSGTIHNFVIIGIEQDKLELVDLNYLCFIVSSQTNKNNSVNLKFPYNEPISPNKENGLVKDSHVKCDILFENIKEKDIVMRVGTITPEQYTRFITLYSQSKL